MPANMYRLLFLFFIAFPFSAHSDSIQQLKNEILQQQYSQATGTGLALLKTSPNDDQVLFLTALAFQHNKQPEQALKYYEQLVQHNPDLPEPFNNMALIHIQQGHHDQAVDALIASLKTHPAYATAWKNLSNLYEGLASEAYRKALSEENQTDQVLDTIQLAELNDLYSLQQKKHKHPEKEIAPVQLASSETEPPASNETVVAQEPRLKQPQPSDPSSGQEQILIDTVKNWASAWSNKNFDAYVAAYTQNYEGGKDSHESWVEHRRSRILRPGYIDVELDNIHIKSSNKERAVIDFEQAFNSPGYRDKVLKRIILILQDNHWKIDQERTISVL
jgi:Tfp pilus assembly protein PilF